jgi:hypothetical protein
MGQINNDFGGGFLKGSPHFFGDGTGIGDIVTTTGGTTIATGTASDGHPFISGTLTLFTIGSESYNDNLDLFITGESPINNNIPLFTSGIASKYSSIPLYTSGFISESGGIDLFIEGCSLITGSIPLYINGISSDSISIPLYVSGCLSENGGIDLFIEGDSLITQSIPLYISSFNGMTGGIDMFLSGVALYGQVIPLYTVSGANQSGEVDMYTLGSYSLSQSTPLYVFGLGHINAGLNLFLEGMISENINSSINLFMYGATTPTSFSSIPMYTQGTYRNINNFAPLFIQAPSSGIINAGMNLFLENFPGISNSLPLFVQNSFVEHDNFLWLFTKGAGQNPGAYPISAGMNMFLQQNTVAETKNGNIPLVISGLGIIDNTIDMYIIGENKNISDGVTCFTSGVIPVGINSGIDLSIPYTSGYEDQFINLYTHGFDFNFGPGV